MSNKVGIITFIDDENNYGQVLQCYALQRYLRDNYPHLEVKVFYISTFIKSTKESFFKQMYKNIKSVERILRTYFYAYVLRKEKYIKRLTEQTLTKSKSLIDEKKALKICEWNKARDFTNFKKAHIALHNDELQAFMGYTDELEADCYIVGSDQVWNDWGSLNESNLANGKHWLDFYALEFLPPNHKSKKISYAASLGKAEFGSEGEKAYFKKALAKFDTISVRESCNIKTLNEIGFKAECVPDPTQLLTKSDYEKLIESSLIKGEFDSAKSDGKVRKESVFVYMLGHQTLINKDEMMRILESRDNIIYTNSNVDFSCAWDYKSDFAPTPQEWIACVRDCKLMITNSFHGCAFAITMNTPFVALKLGGARGWGAMNTRFYQLFELFGLQNRLVDNLADLQAQMNEPIEWDKINVKLKEWRNVGVDFLNREINGL